MFSTAAADRTTEKGPIFIREYGHLLQKEKKVDMRGEQLGEITSRKPRRQAKWAEVLAVLSPPPCGIMAREGGGNEPLTGFMGPFH